MSKYIIKNCPAWQPHEIHYCYNSGNTMICPIHDDCILKQIVEKCKDKGEEFNCASVFAQEILDLLQIEEVE